LIICPSIIDGTFDSFLDDDNVSHCSSSFSKASTPDEKKDEAEDEEWTVVNKTPEATPIHVVEANPEAVAKTTRDIPIQVRSFFFFFLTFFKIFWFEGHIFSFMI
jgi:hypothetical protein